jgi:hypothetical protein
MTLLEFMVAAVIERPRRSPPLRHWPRRLRSARLAQEAEGAGGLSKAGTRRILGPALISYPARSVPNIP